MQAIEIEEQLHALADQAQANRPVTPSPSMHPTPEHSRPPSQVIEENQDNLQMPVIGERKLYQVQEIK